MRAYAVGIISETCPNDAIRRYLEKIDATLQPYSGKYIIHGGPYRWLEGKPTGDLIVIEFASPKLASAWYESAAYQEIKPLRAENSVGTIFLVQGVSDNHCAIDILS
jgi:uncharacterized protein (DUF1330 family)